MASLMTRKVPFHEAGAVLNQIDEFCEAAIEQSDNSVNICHGPFSAFSLQSPVRFKQYSPGTDNEVANFTFDLEAADVWQAVLPETLFDFSSMDDDECTKSSFGTSLAPSHIDIHQDFPLKSSMEIEGLHTEFSLGGGPMTNSIPPSSSSSLLQDASFLLKHYADEVIPSLTPFRHTKTPWHVLFLPNTMITLTALMIGNTVDEASLSNFYGILTISALDLYHKFKAQKWKLQAECLRQFVASHIETVLQHALDLPKRFKYKSSLMALLTMVQITVSVVSGYILL